MGFPLNQGLVTKKIPRVLKTPNGHKEILLPPIVRLIQKTPVAGYGRIASESVGGFFLIDAMVNQGNSGSPVFVRKGVREKTGPRCDYDFIGIIKGYKSDNIVFRSEDGHTMAVPHNSGLVIVISIEAIRKFINAD